MSVISNKKIDLSNYKEEDLISSVSSGDNLSIQVKGQASIQILGRNALSSDFYVIAGINMSNYEIYQQTTGEGFFTYDIAAFDEVKINVVSGGNGSYLFVRIGDN